MALLLLPLPLLLFLPMLLPVSVLPILPLILSLPLPLLQPMPRPCCSVLTNPYFLRWALRNRLWTTSTRSAAGFRLFRRCADC